jgi:uncharacterized protein DUF3455
MNRSRSRSTAHAFRSHCPDVALAALGLRVLAAPARADHSGEDLLAPDLGHCRSLQVPAGNRVHFHALGVGVQIYRWDGTEWIFVAPETVLFADAGEDGVVGIHFGGPTWQSNSGSKVIGRVLQHRTPDPDAIPWRLLEAASTERPGIFQKVTYIQQLYTVGGNAPADPGAFRGEVARVPCTADYFFYRKGR